MHEPEMRRRWQGSSSMNFRGGIDSREMDTMEVSIVYWNELYLPMGFIRRPLAQEIGGMRILISNDGHKNIIWGNICITKHNRFYEIYTASYLRHMARQSIQMQYFITQWWNMCL